MKFGKIIRNPEQEPQIKSPIYRAIQFKAW